MADVKTSSRAERALQTRRRMLEAARDHFIEPGFGATTMDQIAAAAGVAVQTLYYTFRTKGQLLTAVIEFIASGEVNPGPPMERLWIRKALSSDSAVRIIELIVDNGTAIYAGVAPLSEAIRAGQADTAFAAYWSGVSAGRKAGMSRMIARIDDLGALKTDVTRATDQLAVLHSHESYRGLVIESGWTSDQYREWVRELLVAQLLDGAATERLP